MNSPAADRRLQEILRQFGRPVGSSVGAREPADVGRGRTDGGCGVADVGRGEDPPLHSDQHNPHRIDLDRLGPGLWEQTDEGPVFALDRADAGDGLALHPARACGARWSTLATIAPFIDDGPEVIDNAAFLDTETTGLAGGTGTYAFLVGVAYFQEGVPRVRQYLLDSPAREGAMLLALRRFLGRFDALVTFNGATFDLPLLESRFITSRIRWSASSLPHLDLLQLARRVYSGRIASCRLQELERQLLGLARDEDVPGFEVPSRYFAYLRTGALEPLRDVLTHNAQDVVSLMSVAAYLARLVDEGPRDGREAFGLARVHERAGRHSDAAGGFRAALDHPLADRDRREARRRMARAHRRDGDWDAAVAAWEAAVRDGEPFSITAHIELAKYYEHRRKDVAAALDYARRALAVLDRAARLAPGWAEGERVGVERRVARLTARLARRPRGLEAARRPDRVRSGRVSEGVR